MLGADSAPISQWPTAAPIGSDGWTLAGRWSSFKLLYLLSHFIGADETT